MYKGFKETLNGMSSAVNNQKSEEDINSRNNLCIILKHNIDEKIEELSNLSYDKAKTKKFLEDLYEHNIKQDANYIIINDEKFLSNEQNLEFSKKIDDHISIRKRVIQTSLENDKKIKELIEELAKLYASEGKENEKRLEKQKEYEKKKEEYGYYKLNTGEILIKDEKSEEFLEELQEEIDNKKRNSRRNVRFNKTY